MKQPSEGYQLTLRILSVIALIVYIIFLIGEKAPLIGEASFQGISVYLLFLVFLAGFIAIWRYELLSGILYIVWYGFEWCLGLWVWEDSQMVLAMGFPIFIVGLLSIIYGLRKRSASGVLKSQGRKTE
jgi:hypothetical protein